MLSRFSVSNSRFMFGFSGKREVFSEESAAAFPVEDPVVPEEPGIEQAANSKTRNSRSMENLYFISSRPPFIIECFQTSRRSVHCSHVRSGFSPGRRQSRYKRMSGSR